MVEPTMDLSIHFFEMLTQKQLLSEGKKSETELTASVLKKRSKTHKRLNECFLIGRNIIQLKNVLLILRVLDLWLPEQYWCISTKYEVL